MHYYLHSLYLFNYIAYYPITYLVRDARIVKDSKSCYNLLVYRQEVCIIAVAIIILLLLILLLHRILRYSYSISLYLELAYKHLI
jgi:hypothetical protein